MKIGLHAPRRSSFWLVGPLAHLALKRGHEVWFLRDQRAIKPGDGWTPEERAKFFPGAQQGLLENFLGDWVAGPPPKQNMTSWDYQYLLRHDVQLCSIDPWLDSLAMPYEDQYDMTHRTTRHGLVPTDGLEDVTPGDATDLVWFPPKSSVEGFASKAYHYAVTLLVGHMLSRWALRERLRFVIKTRPKITLPKRVLEAAVVVSDNALYPHDSLTLLARARYAVCHQSAAAMEAAAAGVRCLSIHLPQRHLRTYSHYALMQARFGSPYAWPGVVDCMTLGQRFTLNTQMDWQARAAYIDTWFGGRVMGTSEWLLDEMEKRA